jgi:hypothetical protein
MWLHHCFPTLPLCMHHMITTAHASLLLHLVIMLAAYRYNTKPNCFLNPGQCLLVALLYALLTAAKQSKAKADMFTVLLVTGSVTHDSASNPFVTIPPEYGWQTHHQEWPRQYQLRQPIPLCQGLCQAVRPAFEGAWRGWLQVSVWSCGKLACWRRYL